MSSRCELCNRPPLAGNNVSHANNHTRRTFQTNVQPHTCYSSCLGESVTFDLCNKCDRTLNRKYGVDDYVGTPHYKQNQRHFSKKIRTFLARAAQCTSL